MTTMTYVVWDSTTMLRRNLKHMQRYPSLRLMLIGQPVLFLLLFVYVFGGTMGAGLPGVRAAPTTWTTLPGHPDHHRCLGGAEHGDLRREGCDRGDHRPVQDDADLPGVGADLWWAIGWCVVIAALSYAWARRLFSLVRAG